MSRIATLVLVSPAGDLLGVLPPLELPCPFWPESADITSEAASRFRAQVVVLRLLATEPSRKSGGQVSYLAELHSGDVAVELSPVPEYLRERAQRCDEKRMPWAEVGGPARSLDWARGALGSSGRSSFNAVQQRTWNLSTLWRLEATSPTEPAVWLKQVPSFMSHESAVLRWLNRAAPGTAPTLLADDDDGRSLLAHVAGDDLYGAPALMRHYINEQLHVIQRAGAEAVSELLALDVPDLRGARRSADIRQKLLTWAPDHAGLADLLHRLDEHVERLDSCGLPATLVHSDNHPGNARGVEGAVILLDWGEAFIGSPVTDLLGAIHGLSAAEAAGLKANWCASWRRLAPHSKPELALELAPFIAAMHGAATYAHFLEHIEETEWPYHSEDVPRCLQDAADLLRRD